MVSNWARFDELLSSLLGREGGDESIVNGMCKMVL
jgi:hypothetical protein